MATTGSSEFDPQKIITYKFPESTYTYSERDVALYALGVGACAKDALGDKELKFVYHPDGQQSIQVLPTFVALFSIGFSKAIAELPGLQKQEIYSSILTGKAIVLEVEIKSYEKVSGDLLCMNRMAVFLRGAGGFSKSSNPYSYSKYPANQTAAPKIPKGQPFVVFEEYLQPPQACEIKQLNNLELIIG
nr:enoyl-CoA hydratase 2, peroxisomal [Ipomoea batatas]